VRPSHLRRRTWSAGFVVALAIGSVTACSGERPTFDDGPGATLSTATTIAAPRPGTVLVGAWADEFCGSFASWQRDAASAGDQLTTDLADTSDPAAVRDSLVGLLEHLTEATDDLAEEVRGGTVPDVDDGPRLVEALASRLDDLSTTFDGYREQAEAIDVDDPDTFQADVDSVVDDMNAGQDRVVQSFEEIDRDFPDPPLQRELNRACLAG
jgi:hypothetical protein